jgi:hypothetical protein
MKSNKNKLRKSGAVRSSTGLAGVELIKAERLRQISQEGWTPAHDDMHRKHELGLAASSYLNCVVSPDEEGDENGKVRPCWDWPWAKKWWKPSNDPIRNLVKAGALIAAEIDRLERLNEKLTERDGSARPYEEVRREVIMEVRDFVWNKMRAWEKRTKVNAGAGHIHHELEMLANQKAPNEKGQL